MDFTLSVDTVSQTEAVVRWHLPKAFGESRNDIDHFEFFLFFDGKHSTREELNRAAFGPLVFTDAEVNSKADYYHLSGLEPSTIYRAQVHVSFIKGKWSRQGDYSRLSGVREKKDGSLTPLKSADVFVMT